MHYLLQNATKVNIYWPTILHVSLLLKNCVNRIAGHTHSQETSLPPNVSDRIRTRLLFKATGLLLFFFSSEAYLVYKALLTGIKQVCKVFRKQYVKTKSKDAHIYKKVKNTKSKEHQVLSKRLAYFVQQVNKAKKIRALETGSISCRTSKLH